MNRKSESTLEKFRLNLRAKNYARNTIDMYVHYAEEFLRSFDVDVYHISQAKAKEYLINKEYSSVSKQNQIISAVKALYRYVVGVKLERFNVERPRSEKRLPQVIDGEFLLSRINEIGNLKHKAIISLAYSVGLRVSEVCNLKIEDVDSKRMLITIRQSKGRKDRLVPLSDGVLCLLRSYYREYRPSEYLFNGQNKPRYTPSSCNKLVKNYLGEQYHFHLLRHSCFTSMLENGTDLRVIQNIAGHNSSKTTEVYTHVTTQMLHKVATPL